MVYLAKNFEHLYGLKGFSQDLLKNHFQLYQGYVKNTNKLLEELKALVEKKEEGAPSFAEFKRRFGWEFNGMRLHEYYFSNMKNDAAALSENSSLRRKITEDFGSYENWKKDFKATGAMRGIGWAILVYDSLADRLLNLWINEHDLGHCAGLSILLVLDAFEHAYMLDYGVKKEDYLSAFFKVVDWKKIEKRFLECSVNEYIGAHTGH